jgi:hypothetical protein
LAATWKCRKLSPTSFSTRATIASSPTEPGTAAATAAASVDRRLADVVASASSRYAGRTLFSTSAPRWSRRSASARMKKSASWAGLASSVLTTTNVVRRSSRTRSTGPRPLDEAVVHRLEEDEELGDVLEERGAEDAVGHLVEGPEAAFTTRLRYGASSHRSRRDEKNSAMRSGASRKSRAFLVGGVSTMMRSYVPLAWRS